MNDELNLTDYIKIIKKQYIWAILGFILVFGAIAAYTFLSQPVYESKSLIVITSQDQANFLLGSSAPKVTDLETQKIIIQSPNILYPLYEKYGENSFKLTVNNIKNSNVIEIVVDANSVEHSVSIANEIAQSYLNYTTTLRTEDAQANIEFINQKIAVYDDELVILNKDLTYYKVNEKVLTNREQSEYNTLQREITAKNKIYDYLLTKKEEADLTANLKNANLKIIAYAQPPLKPVSPNIELNLVLGFILAMTAGVGLAMVANSMVKESKSSEKSKKN